MGEGQGLGVPTVVEVKFKVGAEPGPSVIAGGHTATQPSPIEGEGFEAARPVDHWIKTAPATRPPDP